MVSYKVISSGKRFCGPKLAMQCVEAYMPRVTESKADYKEYYPKRSGFSFAYLIQKTGGMLLSDLAQVLSEHDVLLRTMNLTELPLLARSQWLRSCISSGYRVILSVVTAAGSPHYVSVEGYEDVQGGFYIYNPNSFNPEEELVIGNEVWSEAKLIACWQASPILHLARLFGEDMLGCRALVLRGKGNSL